MSGFRTCTSSLYTSTYGQLIPEFHTNRLVCTLGLSLFVAGLGTGPMILSPLSEACTPCYACSLSLLTQRLSFTGADPFTSVLLPSSLSG